MNRLLIFIMLLNSCAIVQPTDVPGIAKTLIFGSDQIEVSDSFYDEMEYSFAKINIGRSASAILVLSSSDNGSYTWIGAGNERVITRNGKIIYTAGLEHNVNYLSSFPSSERSIKNSSYMVELFDPYAIIEVKLEYTSEENNIFSEKFLSTLINWKGENLYYTDLNGRVYKTTQFYHPMAPKVNIDFYYK